MTDRKSAMPLWAEFQQLVVDDAPYTFLFVQDNLLAHHKRLRGVSPDVRGFLANVRSWWIPEGERRYAGSNQE